MTYNLRNTWHLRFLVWLLHRILNSKTLFSALYFLHIFFPSQKLYFMWKGRIKGCRKGQHSRFCLAFRTYICMYSKGQRYLLDKQKYACLSCAHIPIQKHFEIVSCLLKFGPCYNSYKIYLHLFKLHLEKHTIISNSGLHNMETEFLWM